MRIKFSEPMTLNGIGNKKFKKRPPVHLRELAKGRRIQFVFPAMDGAVEWPVDRKVGEFVQFTYNTDIPSVLDARKFLGNQKYVDFCQSLTQNNIVLDDSIINLYAKNVYDLTNTEGYDNTGLPSMSKTHNLLLNMFSDRRWKLEKIFVKWEWQCKPFNIALNILPNVFENTDFSIKAMEHRVGYLVNWWICENDITISEADRARLVEATDKYAMQVYDRKTIAVSTSHIQASNKKTKKKNTHSRSLTEIFDQWARDEAENKDTVRKWRTVLVRLIAFLGHEIANEVDKTDMKEWRLELENSGRSMNTINGQDIPATKRIFSYGFEMDWIDTNPAAILSYVKKAKKLPDRMGYTTDEVVEIIKAAKLNTSPDLRWIPVLAASVGARVSEVAQIHESQIKPDKLKPTIWTVQIEKSKDGQSVKNDGSVRTVPLLPKLFGDDFVAFVATRKGKFLFSDREYDPDRKTPHFSSTINKSRRWIISLGIDHTNKSPHHAFRHWWKGQAESREDINLDLVEYVQGHSGARRKSNRMYNKNPSQEECLKVVEAVFADLDIE